MQPNGRRLLKRRVEDALAGAVGLLVDALRGGGATDGLDDLRADHTAAVSLKATPATRARASCRKRGVPNAHRSRRASACSIGSIRRRVTRRRPVEADEFTRPVRSPAHPREHREPVQATVQRIGQVREERGGQQEVDELAGLLVDAELGPHVGDVVVEFGGGRRHRFGAAHPADHGLLGQVAVLLLVRQPPVGVLEGAHDHPRDAGVHPGDQFGVERTVRDAVGSGAVDVAHARA